ncbi:MAG: hypothetical protein E7438_00595 [Ruminococcaceae bacterium]|nr:hypothetical protein [Oscillospiraceae bacterium]
MIKKQLFFMVLGVIGFIGTSICWFLTITHTVLLGYCGFAVDSSGNLYLGLDHQISVYSDGALIRTITTGTSRSFAFTIEDGDNLILSTSTVLYEMDLYGNVIEKSEDENARRFLNMQRNRSFATEDGRKYECKNILGYIQILSEGEVIYKMPTWHYIVLIVFVLSIICFAAGVIMTIYYIKIEGL